MSRSIWKSAVWFALVGPPVGAAAAICLLLASVALHKVFGRVDGVPLTEISEALLIQAAIILIAAYPIGGPAAFGAGATIGILSRRAIGKAWAIAASVLVGAAISMATVYGLNEYVLPHPHGDAAAPFGAEIWLVAGGVGGLAAAVCGCFGLRRA